MVVWKPVLMKHHGQIGKMKNFEAGKVNAPTYLYLTTSESYLPDSPNDILQAS
jgi:hypothetical protein